jgi:hypothetical protein
MKELKVAEGQTLIDIAIQEYGCYEGLHVLMADNNIGPNGLVEDGETFRLIKAGDLLLIREEVPELTESNRTIAAYYKINRLRVNTGYQPNGDFDWRYDFEQQRNSFYITWL